MIVTALLDEAYQRSNQIYRNWTRALAALVAIALAMAGGRELRIDPAISLLIGLLATPLAPIAKDISYRARNGGERHASRQKVVRCDAISRCSPQRGGRQSGGRCRHPSGNEHRQLPKLASGAITERYSRPARTHCDSRIQRGSRRWNCVLVQLGALAATRPWRSFSSGCLAGRFHLAAWPGLSGGTASGQ